MIDLNGFANESRIIATIKAQKMETKPKLFAKKTSSLDGFEILKHCIDKIIDTANVLIKWSLIKEKITRTQKQNALDVKKDLADKLAEIIVCMLTIANEEGIDIETALCRIQTRNRNQCKDFTTTVSTYYKESFNDKEIRDILKQTMKNINDVNDGKILLMKKWRRNLGGVSI